MSTFEKINIAILLVTVSYIIGANNLLSRIDHIEPAARWIITRPEIAQRSAKVQGTVHHG